MLRNSEIVYNEWSELSEETSAENSLSGFKKLNRHLRDVRGFI